ncbi:MAG: Hpt domain-containing protein, partial [Deltaproteobacteria bacterium]
MAEDPDKYLPLFIAEASEQLELLTSELVRIEQEPAGGPVWDSIFRRVHSVKGSAATLGLTAVVDIAHSAETLIGKLKAQNHKPERGQVDLLLQATDALISEIQLASARLERSRKEDTGNSAQLLARLSDASRSLPEITPSPPPPVQKPEPKVAVDPSLPRLDVFFSLSRACQAPGARALIVQRKLKALGTLLEIE